MADLCFKRGEREHLLRGEKPLLVYEKTLVANGISPVPPLLLPMTILAYQCNQRFL
jgi:hypothetical protein